ncbi:MAG: hypothetical protein KDD61_11380 [Bdellovibrionales bacterium]|nr:hypothetical protein [Bdellovibrionales bacterium]
MKFTSKNLIFALIVSGIVAFAVVDYFRLVEEQRDHSIEELVFGGWDFNDIERVTIDNRDKRVKIQRTENGTWKLLEPIVDRADRTQVAFYVDGMLRERFVSVDPSTDLADLGLEESEKSITMLHSSGSVKTIIVGDKAAMGEGRFLLRESEVLVGTSMWEKYVNPIVSQIRSREIFPYMSGSLEVLGLNINLPNGDEFLFKKSNGQWQQLVGAAHEKPKWDVAPIIDSIGNLKAMNIVVDDADKKHKALFGLEMPQLVIKMSLIRGKEGQTKSEEWSLSIGQPHNGYVFAVGTDRNLIYRLSEDRVKEIQKLFQVPSQQSK